MSYRGIGSAGDRGIAIGASDHRGIEASGHRGIAIGPSGHRIILVVCAVVTVSCGKVGPPLPPFRPAPAPVSDISVYRAGNEVRIRFVLPTVNDNAPGPVDLDRIEIYAGTVAAGAVSPPNRELFATRHLIAKIDVKPRAVEGKPAPAVRPNDTRPSPGEMTTFVEELNAAKLEPVFITPAPPVLVAPVAPTSATTVTKPVEPPLPPIATRIYGIRGVTRGGRPGSPGGRIVVPILDPPSPPTGMSVQSTEKAILISWTPPAPSTDPTEKPVRFNVYASVQGEAAVREGTAPSNSTPVESSPYERPGVEFGREECFVVRSVMMARGVRIESAPSDRVCTTPVDTFAPAEPKGLQAVASSGAISLIWDANTEADLAGYLVLRGVAPGDKLQALTPAPIRDTTFRDTTVKPGVRYVYAIIAVDRATPPNISGQSSRVEETVK